MVVESRWSIVAELEAFSNCCALYSDNSGLANDVSSFDSPFRFWFHTPLSPGLANKDEFSTPLIWGPGCCFVS